MRFQSPGLAVLVVVAALAGASTARAAETKDSSWIAPAKAAASEAAATAWNGATDLGVFALGLIGVHYRYGGTDPEVGLDCSGLIQYVFEQVTGVTLPRTSRELAKLGDRVSFTDLEPGDLVFFNTRHFAFSHVGLYLGDNRFIHAPSRGREVIVASLTDNYWKKRFDGARRLIGVLPALLPSLASPALATEAPPHDAAVPAGASEPAPVAPTVSIPEP